MLHTLYNLHPSPEPNLTVLWSKHLPENWKRFVAKVSCDTDAIADSALSLLADDDRRRRMVETQRRSFDGQAAQRIADAVLSRCGKARVLL